MKTCIKCKEVKFKTEFYTGRTDCKVCKKQYSKTIHRPTHKRKAEYLKRREVVLIKAKHRYRLKNPIVKRITGQIRRTFTPQIETSSKPETPYLDRLLKSVQLGQIKLEDVSNYNICLKIKQRLRELKT
mgnify:CR=1 FL=1